MRPNHVHKAKVLDVHDGDTFTCLARLDFFVRAEIAVRLHNYSAPELNQPNGDTALNMLKAQILGHEVMINSVFSEKATEIQEEGTRSFTRWVCDVDMDGVSINDWMNTNAPKGGN